MLSKWTVLDEEVPILLAVMLMEKQDTLHLK
jgi:hypothetical protein